MESRIYFHAPFYGMENTVLLVFKAVFLCAKMENKADANAEKQKRRKEKKFLAIGEFAFAYHAFKEVAIPANTEKIGEGAFVYVPDLSSIEVDASNAYFTLEGGLLLNKKKTALLAYPGGKEDKKRMRFLEQGFTYEINLDTFTVEIVDYNGKETIIYIPEQIEGFTVTSLSGYAFTDLQYMAKIILPASIQYIVRLLHHLFKIPKLEKEVHFWFNSYIAKARQ